MQYKQLNKQSLLEEQALLTAKLAELKEKDLKLDMSRGKPDALQLDLSLEMLDIKDYISDSGIDTRNYGNLEGLPEARALFAELLDCEPSNVIVGGNASLQLMYIMFEIAWRKGFIDSEKPLCACEKVKFLCPVPGYDRHHTILEDFGIEMVNVPMTTSGPDMDIVEKLVAQDRSIKGMWSVPVYSNPQGYVYSEQTVKRMCAMSTAAPDFKIFLDNAYVVHHLDGEHGIPSMLECSKQAGNPNRVLMFCSTSKITFAGAGVGAVGASEEQIAYVLKQMNPMTIGFDKLNQLRHVKYLKNKQNILKHMEKHAEIIKPKFDAVEQCFEEQLSYCDGLVSFSEPCGGYFVNFEAMPGTAKQIVELCKQTGVVLTPAGAAFPYGNDPEDKHIRIAPTFPPLAELKQALEVFVTSVRLATVQKLLENVTK